MHTNSPLRADNQDLETQPLLRPNTEESQLLNDEVRINVANETLIKSRWRSIKCLIIYLLGIVLLSFFGVSIVQYIRGHVPPTDVIEKNLVQVQISNWWSFSLMVGKIIWALT